MTDGIWKMISCTGSISNFHLKNSNIPGSRVAFSPGGVVLCLLLLLSFLYFPCFAGETAGKPTNVGKEGKLYVVPDVEYRNQNEKGRSQWCVVYSTYMLLTRYGIHEKPENIAKEMDMEERGEAYFSWKSVFSQDGSVEKFLQDKHNLETRKKIFVTLRKPYEKWIKDNIREGSPVLLLYGRMNGHAILLVGYDEKYLYINDPSGAFFSDSTKVLGRPTYPTAWCRENRTSRFEGAGVLWSDFRKFLKKHNYWGYMLAVTGKKADEKKSDGQKPEEQKPEEQKPEEQKQNGNKADGNKAEDGKPENGVGEKRKDLWDSRKLKLLFM